MSLRLPDKDISVKQLSEELAALAVPGLIGVARLGRQWVPQNVVNEQGETIGITEILKPCARYILIKCGDLTPTQEDAINKAIRTHRPLAVT